VKKIPRDAADERMDTRRASSNAAIKKATVLGLLDALGVTKAELRELLRP
jgi:hypothetical protein